MSKVNPLIVTTVMLLEGMECLVLSSAMLSLTGFGDIGKETVAYEPMLKANLINENGTAKEHASLVQALDYEINKRTEAGTWN